MRHRAWILAACLIASPAAAGNWLINPTFNSDLSGWSYIGTGVWDSSDALAIASSGSVRGTNNSASGFTYDTVLLSSCLTVTPGSNYDGSIDYRIPSGQGVTTQALLEVSWYTAAGCTGGGYVGSQSIVVGLDADDAWHRVESAAALTAPATAVHALVRVEVVKLEAGGLATAYFDNLIFKPEGSCGTTADRLCLNNDRFQVTATYLDYAGHHGPAKAQAMTADTGYFWFFSPANVEVVLKVINGCGFNSAYWIYAGGLTDVDVQLVVKDVRTGAVKQYGNNLGTPFQPIGDIQALATCP